MMHAILSDSERRSRRAFGALAPTLVMLLVLLAACNGPNDARARESTNGEALGELSRTPGTEYIVKDSFIVATLEAAGTAEPVQQSTLSTKLMSIVKSVRVQEGDRVAAGQVLVELDARDLDARRAQVNAAIADAEAMHREAEAHLARIQALFADSAATRVQLEAAETGVARSGAALRAAHASSSELDALTSYATITAPFPGIVTRRFVDPGAFAAPGAPLIAIQDVRQLRVSVTVAPETVRELRRGAPIDGLIEGRSITAMIEGIVPGSSGNLYTINALVANGDRAFLAGSAATLLVPLGQRQALLVPARAVLREGDLTGVVFRASHGDETRWIRLGAPAGDLVEVTAGLQVGDTIIMPVAAEEM